MRLISSVPFFTFLPPAMRPIAARWTGECSLTKLQRLELPLGAGGWPSALRTSLRAVQPAAACAAATASPCVSGSTHPAGFLWSSVVSRGPAATP